MVSQAEWRRSLGNVRSFVGNATGGLRGWPNMASWVVAGTLAYFLWVKPAQDLKKEQQIMSADRRFGFSITGKDGEGNVPVYFEKYSSSDLSNLKDVFAALSRSNYYRLHDYLVGPLKLFCQQDGLHMHL